MLKGFQETLPLDESRSHHAYLEAWQYGDDLDPLTRSLTIKSLDESDLGSWVWRRDAFATSSGSSRHGRLSGGLRVLFTQSNVQLRYDIPSVLVKTQVLEVLQLPPHTFSLIFRTPSNTFQIGGYAVTHDFDTAITTALILGDCFELDRYNTRVGSKAPLTKLEEFVSQVRDCGHLWSHPLLVPCLLLGTHARLVRSYILTQTTPTVTALERVIGVTRTDQRLEDTALQKAFQIGGVYAEQDAALVNRLTGKLFVDDRLQREEAKILTQLINTITKKIIYLKRSPQWDMDCVKFLRRILDESQRLSKHPSVPAQTFRETLDYVESYSEICAEVAQTCEARVQLHLNILYTSVAQDDGQTSAQLAAAAGRDSTSMKIIALITAAYLPATFVATLFSMGMFEWKSSSPDTDGAGAESSSISPDFWMYWAVTIPLTVITLAGWGAWWEFEKRRFDDKSPVKNRPSDDFQAPGVEKSGLKNVLPLPHGRAQV
ncbi:hypothetical protein E8E14_008126 [Neopestalotiopsis sp. 37M]|nr:hypothetical protein E8E14_008126 [Neopestalotiopsis sp. 37M]